MATEKEIQQHQEGEMGEGRREGRSLLDLGFTTSLKSNNISFGPQRGGKRKKSSDKKCYTQLELTNLSTVSVPAKARVVKKCKRRVIPTMKLSN